MTWLRRHYGAGPLHLLGLLACFAVAAYAVTRVIGAGGWVSVFQWFLACLVLHDFVAWPVYAFADRLLVRARRGPAPGPGPVPGRRRPAVPWVNHVRVPVVISAVLLAMFLPLIFRLSKATYLGTTGFSEDAYFTNWLLVTGVLFAASGLAYVLRLGLGRRRSRAPAGARPGAS